MTNIPDAERVDVSKEMDEAARNGLIDGFVFVGRPDELPELTVVRPVVEDDGLSWPGELGALLGARQGSVVGFASVDARLAAELAAAYASWRGDRGGDVVLVDGSLERPVIDRPLLEDGHEGFVDAVLYGVSASAVARRTLAGGVRVVTAGSRPLTIGRALDPTKVGEFAREVGAGLALLVLPLKYAPLVAESLDAIVIIDEDENSLLSAASSARGAGTKRVVCVRPVRSRSAAGRPASAERADSAEGPTTGGPTPTDGEAPGAQETSPQSSSGEEPTTPEEGESFATAEADEPAPFLKEGEPPPFLREDEPLVIEASGPRARSRGGGRRVVGVIALAVVAAVVVWGWLGPALRGERGPSWRRPVSEAGRRTTEQSNREPVAVKEERAENAAERLDEGPGAPGEANAQPEAPTAQAGAAREPAAGEGQRGVEASEGEPAVVLDESSPLSGPGGPYVIYLSSQRLRTAAQVEVEQAEKAGLLAEIVDADVPGSGMWHRVALVGGFPTLAEARNTLDIIRELGYEGAWIARVPQEK